MPVPLEMITSRWYGLARAGEALGEFLLPTHRLGLLTDDGAGQGWLAGWQELHSIRRRGAVWLKGGSYCPRGGWPLPPAKEG